ncbi:MAG TPA: hypothetical protein VH619_09160 [Verrucomicrobiae bacterium]|jgi:hypothetical protein|nr:hypothetical protein [Verrucomicrobiae bacterium]
MLRRLRLEYRCATYHVINRGGGNQNYTLQISTNLASANWSSLFSFIPANSPRFYRAIKGP